MSLGRDVIDGEMMMMCVVHSWSAFFIFEFQIYARLADNVVLHSPSLALRVVPAAPGHMGGTKTSIVVRKDIITRAVVIGSSQRQQLTWARTKAKPRAEEQSHPSVRVVLEDDGVEESICAYGCNRFHTNTILV
jgi:hypothetical protein